MPSVAVGICPDCHLELVARAMQEAPEVLESIGPGLLPILTGFSRDCEQAARLLARAKIPTSMGKQEATGVFQLLVPAGSRDRAEQVLTEDWEREVAKQGLAPKMEAIPPGNGARCPACGIALT